MRCPDRHVLHCVFLPVPGHILRQLLKAYLPPAITGRWPDHLRAACGAGLGILFTGWLSQHWLAPDWLTTLFLVAPMGASAVILFCLPSSPLAQPWSLLVGNLTAACCGVFFAQHFASQPALAAALAMTSAVGGMFLLRCIHPPSGAVALTAVLGGPAIHALGYQFIFWPILGNSLLLVIAALIYHRLTGHVYPARWSAAASTTPAHLHYQFGFQREDLQAALRQFDEVIDISTDKLQTLLESTEMIAYQRKLEAILCLHIMRPAPAMLEYGDSLEDAWRLLLSQPEPAIPVVNKARLVIGLLGQADFIQHAQPESFSQVAPKFKRLIRRSHTTHSKKPEVVGQIMTTAPVTIREDAHIMHLIPLITTHHLQLIPVVSADNRLVGILTQTDVIRALYR